MAKNIVELIKKLETKINIQAAEYGVADSHSDGFMAKSEATAMQAGLLGGKGALADGTDLNTIKHGGIYYLSSLIQYPNNPLPSFESILTVTGSNGVYYQKIESAESSDMKTKRRVWIGGPTGGWTDWRTGAPESKVIWQGGQQTNGSTINLTDDFDSFAVLKIYWTPNSMAGRVDTVTPDAGGFSLTAINVPNSNLADGGESTFSIEELLFVPSSDKKSLTITSHLFRGAGGSFTYSAADSGKSVIRRINGYDNF